MFRTFSNKNAADDTAELYEKMFSAVGSKVLIGIKDAHAIVDIVPFEQLQDASKEDKSKRIPNLQEHVSRWDIRVCQIMSGHA